MANRRAAASFFSGIVASSGSGVDEAYSFKVEIDPAALDLVLFNYNSVSIVYNYDVDWGDGNTDTGVVVTDHTHTYAAGGQYIVRITGTFPGLAMYKGTAAQREQIISFLNWGTVPMKSLYGMFDQCTEMLYEATDVPNLSELDVAPVITTSAYTFMNKCTSITSLDLSNWTDTDKITDMQSMFNECTDATLFNLTGWDLSNVTQAPFCCKLMGSTGAGCEIIMPNLDWSTATVGNRIYQMFMQAKFSTSPDLTNWTLQPATYPKFSYMFYGCDGAVALDLSTWNNTGSITGFTYSFSTSEFTSLNLTGWDTSNIAIMNNTFSGMSNLTHITGLSGFDASSIGGTSDLRSTWQGCPNLSFGAALSPTNFGVNWGTKLGGPISMSYTFNGCGTTGDGTAPDVSNWDVSGFTSFYQAFISTSGWTNALDFSNWDLSGMTANMGYFMYYNDGTTVVDFTNAAFPSTSTSMTYTFYSSEVEDVTWGATCDFSNVTTMLSHGYGANISSYEFNVTADFSSLAIATNFLNGVQTMDDDPAVQTNYDNFLTRLNATWVDPGGFSGTLTVGASTYTGGGAVAAARLALVTAGWTITDGGIA